METKLVVVGGKANRQEIRLKLPAVLGRGGDADLTVAHPLVSRHHCRLEEVDGALVLRDNNSTNGTFVGKKRITQIVLKPGDQFTVGPLTFKADYKHSGAFPNIGEPALESDGSETAGLPSTDQEAPDLDFTVAFESVDAAKASKAKPQSKPADAKRKAPPTETKPQGKPAEAKDKAPPAKTKLPAKPADKERPPSAKSGAEPIQPAAAATGADDEGVMDWLAGPPASAPSEPEPLAEFDFDEEPVAAEAPAEASPAEETDLPAPPAEAEADVMDWLDEPTAKDAPSEPAADFDFDEEPVAAEAPAEASPAKETDLPAPSAEAEAEVMDWLDEPPASAPQTEAEPLSDIEFGEEPVAGESIIEDVAPAEPEPLAPPADEVAADVMDWLGESEPRAAPNEVESLDSLSFEEEPKAAEALPEAALTGESPAEDADAIASPAADAEAGVLDWLDEPEPASAAQADAEPPDDDSLFGEEPIAAEPIIEDVASAESEPAAAEAEAEVLDWLEEPAVADVPSEPQPFADFGLDEEPVAAEALPEAALTGESPAEDADAIASPAADAEAGVLDWLDEPPASVPRAEAEPLSDIEFGEEPVAAEPIIEDVASAESEPAAAEAEAEVLDWLEEPAVADVPSEPQPFADLGFDEEPVAAEALPEAALPEESPAEEADLITLPAAEAQADVLDWLDEPPASAPRAEAEPLGDIVFGEEPVAAEPIIEDVASAESEPAAAEAEAEVLDWLEEPAVADVPSEPQPFADLGFDEEPVAAEALPEAALPEESPAEEADLITLPAAEADAGVLDWLDEPPASVPRADAEPLGDIVFGEEPVAAEPIIEDVASAESEPAAAEAEAEVLDWLEEPAVADAPSEPQPFADLGFDEEPVAAEALPEEAPAEDAGAIASPTADAEAGALDWLDEPPASAPRADAEPLSDIEFGEEPGAAEPIIEDVARAELEPAAAEAEAEVLDWLEEPAVADAPSEPQPFADLGFDEEPVAAEALPEEAPAEDAGAIASPTADAEAGALDWLDEPPASAPRADAEPLSDIEFGEEPVAAEPIIEDVAPAEPEPLASPANEAEADVMDWLDEPEPRAAHSQVESLESLSFDDEPVPAEPLADFGLDEEPVAAEALPEAVLPEESPAEEADLIALPAADAEADMLDWLDEPAPRAAHSEVESLESLSFDEEPVPAEALPGATLPEEQPADTARVEEADLIASPAADAEVGMLDWLDEPNAANSPAEAEPMADIGLDEVPFAAEPFGATPDDLESELITPPLAEADDMTSFWPGDAPTADPQLEDEASDEMDFDFGDEAEADAALAELPAGEPMFMDEDDVNAESSVPDEALGLDMSLDMEEGAAGLDATEMFDASKTEQQPSVAEPAGFSDGDAFASLDDPGEEFKVTEAAEESVEFDFLADDATAPAATSHFELQDEPKRKLPPSIEEAGIKGAGRDESAAEKPAKKGWWPFGKSKKKEMPEPKGRKSAALEMFEPEETPLPAAESVPVAPPPEPHAPAPQQAAADADATPDFSFADTGNEEPAKPGPDDDLEDFFQDLGFK